MSNLGRDLAGGLWGLTAGVGAMLPTMMCAGGACSSCFACVGVGGLVVSVVAARAVFGRRPERAAGRPGRYDAPPVTASRGEEGIRRRVH